MQEQNCIIATSLLLAICCLQVLPTLQACSDNCEQKWDPVCSTKGKTYANQCIAKCAEESIEYAGRCKGFASQLAKAIESGAFACTDNCEQKWDPVCGSDGKTHANKCIAKCAGASVKHTGRCKTFAAAFACTDNCEQKWDPVCGSDGKTHANECIAKCAGASVKHTGRCKTFTAAFACTDNCEQKWDPVCGSDGKTHANRCIAKCAGATVEHAGRCASGLNAIPTNGEKAKFNCNGVYDPVCGEDNRTYANACLATRANVAIKHAGPCMRGMHTGHG